MEANLDGGAVAKPDRSFPPSNWGPWAAVLGVLAALAVGIFLAVPALFLGAQHGEIEALFPPHFESGVSFDSGDSSALAVDTKAHRLYADHGDEVRVFAAGGEEIEDGGMVGLEDSQGVAFDSRTGTLFVSEKGPGRIIVQFAAGAGAKAGHVMTIDRSDLPKSLAGFEPEAMVFGGYGAGSLFVVDPGDETVLRFSPEGKYLGRLDGSTTPAGSFDFGSNDNGVAVDSHDGPGNGDVYVLSGKGDGAVWQFGPHGRYLWELTPELGDELGAVAVNATSGIPWIAETGGDAYPYAEPSPGLPPERTPGKIKTGDEVRAMVFAGSGHLFVARDLDSTLDTLGNVLSQIATALGFLLVPFALAATRGAKSFREIFARLGLRGFKPSAFKWMGLTVVLYLAFNFFYSTVITEPHQQDIAKGFGSIPIQILLIVIAAPVTEEVCFRGMLFGGLREKLPRIAAALICGLIFGALHAITGISAVPPLIVFGFLLALLYEKTGSIIPGILLHMLNNSIALLSQ
jgi:membrane protease YdiL (CAAX protease family)